MHVVYKTSEEKTYLYKHPHVEISLITLHCMRVRAASSWYLLKLKINKRSKNDDGVYVGYFAIGLHNDNCTQNAAALRESRANAALPQQQLALDIKHCCLDF